MSTDDAAQVPNHIDSEHKTTDIYIEKNWSIVDAIQAACSDVLIACPIKLIRNSNKSLCQKKSRG